MRVYIILCLIILSNRVIAEPDQTTNYTFYKIYPKSKSELGREMHNRSPIKRDGRTFKGHTHWHVKWKYKWKKRNGLCRISKVNTFLSVKYTMPEIPLNHKVEQSVRTSFNKYYVALMNHEKNHMNSGLYAARDIEKALLELKPFISCKLLGESANATGDLIIKKYNKRDKAYDKKTNNGRTEGVNIKNFI